MKQNFDSTLLQHVLTLLNMFYSTKRLKWNYLLFVFQSFLMAGRKSMTLFMEPTMLSKFNCLS